MRTETLIANLVADARRSSLRGLPSWPAVVLLCLGAAALALFSTMGLRPDFIAALGTLRFDLKFVLTGLTALGALLAVRDLHRPGPEGRSGRRLLKLTVTLLAASVVGELATVPVGSWETRLVGSNSLICLVAIPAMGAVPLAILLWSVRKGATTRPGMAGAMCGLASAAVSAFFYAAQCVDDSPLFVAVWYPLAAGFLVMTGLALGRRILRW
ncbi:hypothetical protein NS226_17910 [Aureimonas ureilytica]|uniref:DUF1109 family protein n=1 Tax=Aureimonas ureilytica TaxID=401562 RepID=A0A175R5D1_9HYPH|nr:NrsF family protein [Aureimonas ureilytica]KTQ86456.1 hypothetical protein NS226_17910 [Aureimonas ureilytica]